MSVNEPLQAVFLKDEDGNVVAVVLDGSVYRLQTVGKVLNASGTQINPATQETLASLDGKDFATETTLSAADGRLTTIDAVLDSIKDTDGIKKITDPLPAGTNNIGDVDVASSALPTGAATAANQSTIIGHVDGIEGTLSSIDGKDFATETTLATRAAAATQTDGTQRTQIRSGAKGTAVAANLTSNPIDADTEALHVDGSNVTQPTSNAAASQADGHSASIGSTSDADTTNTVIGRLKQIITKLAGGLPSALTGSGNLQTAISEAIAAGTNEIGKVAQGTKAALSGYWPVRATDGTNEMPTADAAARAIFARITDGTNTIGTLFKTLYSDPNGDRRTIHNDATITANGSTVLTWVGHSEWYLIINIKNAPTGTTPTLQFTIEEVDPIDQTTVVNTLYNFTSDVFTAAGVGIVEIPELQSDTLKISWTVGGSSPSFTGVNVTFCGHGPGNAIEGQAEEGTVIHDAPVPIAGVDKNTLIRSLKVADDGSLIVAPTGSDQVNGFSPGYVQLGGGTSGSLNSVRATPYTSPTTNAQRSVSSSSASDTSAGTGARTVRITYYNQTGAGPFTEVVTLNGTTSVDTVATDICFIEKLVVVTSGSLTYNAGTITLHDATGGGGSPIGTIGVGNIVAGIGDNRTLWAHHYVPPGITTSITSMLVGASASAIFHLRVKDPTMAAAPDIVVSGLITVSASFQRSYGAAIQIPGPARILMMAVPSTNNVALSGSFDFFEG